MFWIFFFIVSEWPILLPGNGQNAGFYTINKNFKKSGKQSLWRTRWSITPRDQMPTSLCETLGGVFMGILNT
jgi:hypothetical protein